MQLIGLLGIGIGAGLHSGMFGVGGGVIIVPAMVLFFGMTQQSAVGTSDTVYAGRKDVPG